MLSKDIIKTYFATLKKISGIVTIVPLIIIIILNIEALIARRRIGLPTPPPPIKQNIFQHQQTKAQNKKPIKLLICGDSLACGTGLEKFYDTPTFLISNWISQTNKTQVIVENLGSIGSQSTDLPRQITAGLLKLKKIDITLILIGSNDVIHLKKYKKSIQCLQNSIRIAQKSGSEVLIGTCPDLGTIRYIWQPLRLIAKHRSKTLAKKQEELAKEMGIYSVSLSSSLRNNFNQNIKYFFGADNFHPSKSGYFCASKSIFLEIQKILNKTL